MKMNDVYKQKCFWEEDLLTYEAYETINLMAATTAIA